MIRTFSSTGATSTSSCIARSHTRNSWRNSQKAALSDQVGSANRLSLPSSTGPSTLPPTARAPAAMNARIIPVANLVPTCSGRVGSEASAAAVRENAGIAASASIRPRLLLAN